MKYLNRRIGRIDPLAARTASSADFDPDVFRFNPFA
jgi:hypothetical protein